MCPPFVDQLPGEKPEGNKHCVASSAILTGCGYGFRLKTLLSFLWGDGRMHIAEPKTVKTRSWSILSSVLSGNCPDSPLKTWPARGNKKEENKTGNQQTIDLNYLLKSNCFYHWKMVIKEKLCTSGELLAWSLQEQRIPCKAASREKEWTSFLIVDPG